MEYTLSKAAEATGKGKSTIHRAIKSGKLSAHRLEDGSYTINAAELHRVFPRKQVELSPANVPDHPTEQQVQPDRLELERLRVKADMLEEQLQRERETIDDLRTRLDRAEERVSLLAAPLAQRATQEPQDSLWERLRRTLMGTGTGT